MMDTALYDSALMQRSTDATETLRVLYRQTGSVEVRAALKELAQVIEELAGTVESLFEEEVVETETSQDYRDKILSY